MIGWLDAHGSLAISPGRPAITSALIGVAGAFIGYHISVLLMLRAGLITSAIAAAIGAAAVIFAWRMAK
jgi:uncharacterized membrane protein YeaQ/YmgE (transglycosylase-associated protein family)